MRTIIGWPAPTKQNTGKAHGSALGEDEIRSDQGDPRLRPGRAASPSPTTCSRTPARSSTAAATRTPSGRPGSTRGPPANPDGARAARPAAAPRSCPTAGPTRCRPSRPRRTASRTRCPPARRPARCSPRSRRRAARAVGRLGRPGREQQHHDGGRAELHPGRAPDQGVARRPVRPHAALRHPRARDGLDHERHHAARRHPRLRRHVPRLQRLHAPAGPAGRADEAADRSTSGPTTRSGSARTARPTSRSSTWPRCGPSPGWTSSARPTPTRPRSCWRAVAGAHRPPGRRWRCPGRTCRCSTAAKVGRRRPRAATSWRRPSAGMPAGHPHRHRLRGVARARRRASGSRPRAPPTRVVSMPCLEWFDAQAASYQQQVLPPDVKARVSVEAGVAHGLARVRRRRRRDRRASTTSAPAPTATCCSSSSASPPTASSRPRTPPCERAGADHAAPPPATDRRRRPIMTDALADLSDAGRLDLARRHQPRAAADRQPAGPVDDQARRRRHQQPDDLPEGAREGRRLRRAGPRPGGARRRRRRARSGYLMAYDIRWACDVLRPVYDAHRRRGRPGVDRGRPAARARHRRAPPPRPRRCGGWSTGPT